jgi:hypothetical protein
MPDIGPSIRVNAGGVARCLRILRPEVHAVAQNDDDPPPCEAGASVALVDSMSIEMIGLAIDTLLNDERLRIRFSRSRIETIADLGVRGIELTPDEIELFIQTDAGVWFWERSSARDPLH